MNRKPSIITIILTLMMFCVSIQAADKAESDPGPMTVFASVAPQSYFIQKIGGNLVSVEVMVQPGASPATYEPKPRQMKALSEATLYFAIGVPFERSWMDRIRSANRDMRVIQTQAGIALRPMMGRHDHDKDHEDRRPARTSGQEKNHAHDRLDPHIWLSPPLVIMQARNIRDALIAADPENRDAFQSNYKAFVYELADLDVNISDALASATRRKFMVFHPSWGYFADAYGLEQIPAEIEGKAPKPADLKRLIDLAQKNNITAIFVQPQFSDQSAKIIADAIKGRVSQVDPLAADWARNLRETAQRFAEAMQ